MKKMKLNLLESSNLSKREMRNVQGGKPGDPCGCSCYYERSGGSSDIDNAWANHKDGLGSANGAYAFVISASGRVYDLRQFRQH